MNQQHRQREADASNAFILSVVFGVSYLKVGERGGTHWEGLSELGRVACGLGVAHWVMFVPLLPPSQLGNPSAVS